MLLSRTQPLITWEDCSQEVRETVAFGLRGQLASAPSSYGLCFHLTCVCVCACVWCETLICATVTVMPCV